MSRNHAQHIGFVSTRFAGTDGVSLESAKWARVLWDHRHVSYWYGGRLDRSADISMCVPEAFFGHPECEWINARLWNAMTRPRLITWRIRDLADYLKSTLYEFVQRFEIDILIIENALSIPMHVPLGVALTEFIAETGIPSIAHHHDFYWERTRFSVNAAVEYLEMAFPPRDPRLQHAVINQAAQEELSWRKGLHSILVPNVLDFESPPPAPDSYSRDLRQALGFAPDDIVILQPTRVVPRKGIEHAIKLVEMLDNPRCKLVISHEARDEGAEYRQQLTELAAEAKVEVRFIDTRIGDVRQRNSMGQKVYTLWDLYPFADLVTYPSLYEGFGNAFLEAVYFRKPVLVNRYSIFMRDIEPKGFMTPVMDRLLTEKVVDEVRRFLEDKDYARRCAEHNYELAKRFFSYSVLRRKLRSLITNITGLDNL